MDDLLSDFIAETQETLEALANDIVAWESDPTDRNRLDAIFRFFHTVKGSSGFLKLPRFENLSHAAEDILSRIREGQAVANTATINAVLAVMDRIAELCFALGSGNALSQEDDDQLIDTLRNCLEEDQQEDISGRVEPAVLGDTQDRIHGNPRTIRLPLNLIDQLMNGVSDMVLARNELARKLREHGNDPDLEIAFERLSACVADMRDTISKTRMQRIERLFMAIPRMVRDLSRELGKRIELTLEGGDVEMDREMVEMVVDPLTHIVRNSIDHGIETPEERLAAGKPETGRLTLSARQSGSQIVIEIEDDGRGIDTEAVVRKVITSGIRPAQEVASLSDQERLELIFAPGLSTAKQVTAVSGRGVGMDVVRANIERLGGVITLTNNPGRGLVITLRVPLTLTIIPGLIVNAGGQQFAIPRSAVIELLHDNNAMVRVSSLAGADVATIRGVRYSMVELESVIGLPRMEQPGPRTLLLVRSASGDPYALNVASVENHEELVIRPAVPLVMAAGVYAGMTLPDNGQPMLLLDAGGIAQVANVALLIENEDETESVDALTVADTYSALHFVELDGKHRVIRLSLVERVDDIPLDYFDEAGGRSFVRMDGRILPCFHSVFDVDLDDQAYVTCLRLRDGVHELCYPVRTIEDILDVPEALDMSLAYGHVAGLCLLEGRQIEVVDSFALFAAVQDEAIEGDSVRCVISNADNGWNREILAPLLRQAGYEVVLGCEGGIADDGRTVLLSSEEDHAVAETLLPVIRLRTHNEAAGPEDDSIYRYDRAALMQAIVDAGQQRKSA